MPPPAPRILAIIDEFATPADVLPTDERRDLWRAAHMIAAEGRKAGVHLMLALQDPARKSLDLRIRRTACLFPSVSKMTRPAAPVRDGDGPALMRRSLCPQ